MSARVVAEGKPPSNWEVSAIKNDKSTHPLLPPSIPPSTPTHPSIGDLWGPLLVCLTLSILLSITAPDEQGALVFAAVFFVVWFGAAVVTLNAQLLGGTM